MAEVDEFELAAATEVRVAPVPDPRSRRGREHPWRWVAAAGALAVAGTLLVPAAAPRVVAASVPVDLEVVAYLMTDDGAALVSILDDARGVVEIGTADSSDAPSAPVVWVVRTADLQADSMWGALMTPGPLDEYVRLLEQQPPSRDGWLCESTADTIARCLPMGTSSEAASLVTIDIDS